MVSGLHPVAATGQYPSRFSAVLEYTSVFDGLSPLNYVFTRLPVASSSSSAAAGSGVSAPPPATSTSEEYVLCAPNFLNTQWNLQWTSPHPALLWANVDALVEWQRNAHEGAFASQSQAQTAASTAAAAVPYVHMASPYGAVFVSGSAAPTSATSTTASSAIGAAEFATASTSQTAAAAAAGEPTLKLAPAAAGVDTVSSLSSSSAPHPPTSTSPPSLSQPPQQQQPHAPSAFRCLPGMLYPCHSVIPNIPATFNLLLGPPVVPPQWFTPRIKAIDASSLALDVLNRDHIRFSVQQSQFCAALARHHANNALIAQAASRLQLAARGGGTAGGGGGSSNSSGSSGSSSSSSSGGGASSSALQLGGGGALQFGGGAPLLPSPHASAAPAPAATTHQTAVLPSTSDEPMRPLPGGASTSTSVPSASMMQSASTSVPSTAMLLVESPSAVHSNNAQQTEATTLEVEAEAGGAEAAAVAVAANNPVSTPTSSSSSSGVLMHLSPEDVQLIQAALKS